MKYVFLITTILFTYSQKSSAKSNLYSLDRNDRTFQADFVEEKITDNLYVLKSPSYHTNVGVFIGTDAVLLIDPMTGSNNHQNLLNAVKRLSSKPIKYVINTHSHPDHSGANLFFAKLGARVISHENFKYTNAQYDQTFKDTFSLSMGNETVELYHIAAHTFDDALVYFKNSNAVFMGDTYMTNSFPNFYYGGGSKGHLKIIDKALSLGNARLTIIPAHGKLSSNKAELNTYKANSIKWINRIGQLYNGGQTTEEIANDQQIKQLSTVFNNGNNVSNQSIIRTINKTIASDLIPSVQLPGSMLKQFEGTYRYSNGQVDEIIYENGKLLFRSKGLYIFEIIPLSETKFQVRGQFPGKHLTFNAATSSFEYFNGKESLRATKQ